MLTGHGSFGHFLWRINKREIAACRHCSMDDDTLEHTISGCPAWDDQRFEFARNLGIDNTNRLTLTLIVGKILEKKEHWSSFIKFATSILKTKEEEERQRERISLSMSPNLGASQR